MQHGFVHAIQHGGGYLREGYTCRREPCAGPHSLKQRNAKRVLQPLDGACQCALVDLQGQSRLAHATMLRNRDHSLKITEVKWVFLCHLKTPIVPLCYLRDQTFLQ